jgi:hypothetical protein
MLGIYASLRQAGQAEKNIPFLLPQNENQTAFS